MPSISVVFPMFNEEDYVRRTVAAAREARLQNLRLFDAVRAKVPEVQAQFAPSCENARGFEEAQRHGPDDALSPCTFFVPVYN